MLKNLSFKSSVEKQCSLCFDVGWVLDWAGGGQSDPACLEMLPCIHPECEQSGVHVATLDVHYLNATAVRHPKDQTVMALTSIRKPKS